MSKNKWTREELHLAINLYYKIPFAKYDRRTPKVVRLAEFIGRTPSAVAMKLSNFASLDSKHAKRGIKGLANTSKLDKEVWNDFNANWNDSIVNSEYQLSQSDKINSTHFHKASITETNQITKVRLGQNFFRDSVIGNYYTRCCICGIPIQKLLIASHIIPWSTSEETRLDPSNGLCLCAIHDIAFDKGLLTVSDTYQVEVSNTIKNYEDKASIEFIHSYNGKSIELPDKFTPKFEYLEFHKENIFKS